MRVLVDVDQAHAAGDFLARLVGFDGDVVSSPHPPVTLWLPD